MRPNLTQKWLLAAVLGVSMVAVAQQAPKIVNAQLHTEQAGGALATTVGRFQRENGPLWLGYEMDAVAGSHYSACSDYVQSSMDDGCCGVYRLEDTGNNYRSGDKEDAPMPKINVLVRIDQGAIQKIRFVSASCRLDAGGLSFTWLTGVGADESILWLASLATKDNDKRLTDQALATIAMHASEKATAVLAGFASSENPLWLREKAAFWLGAGRGQAGLLALEKLVSDGDPEFRKKLVFDLSVNHEPAAIDDMIRMAKTDSNTGVRGEAIFWVGQKAGVKAIGTLKDAIANDPESGVKKEAVFALSQLPKDQAVPELLQVAQNNSDPAVRKEAIFWLGQTHDPRALAYFEKILER
jgi:hypothetical protein